MGGPTVAGFALATLVVFILLVVLTAALADFLSWYRFHRGAARLIDLEHQYSATSAPQGDPWR